MPDPTGHSHGDDEVVRRARYNGTRAIRALEHRTMAAVTKARPSGRAVQKARTGTRARSYRPAVALLERSFEPIDAEAVAERCDDHTRRQHGLLLALADRLQLGPFRVTGPLLENGPLRYVHRHRAGDDEMYGVLLGTLLLDVPDPANGIDRVQAERNLTARAHGHPILIVTGPEDIDRAIRLTRAALARLARTAGAHRVPTSWSDGGGPALAAHAFAPATPSASPRRARPPR